MKFMGKWILWSPLADGYVNPGYSMSSGLTMIGLFATQGNDINDAIFNLYAAPNAGEVLMQSDCLSVGRCTQYPGGDNSKIWLQCNPSKATQDGSVTFTKDLSSASPITMRKDGQWFNLLYNSTPFYLNMISFGICWVVLGNPYGPSDPHLNITVKTESLDTYRQAKSAAGADFSNIDFRGIDLSGIDFTGANFSGAFMDGQTVLPAGTVLRDATFTGAHLDGVQFGGCDLTGADFTDTALAGIHFDLKTKLTGAKFINDDLNHINFSHFDLSGANFTKAKFAGMQFDTQTKFAGAKFISVDFTGLSLAGCDMSGADFTSAILNGFDVQGAKLSSAILTGHDLTHLAPASYRNPPLLAGTSAKLTSLSGAKIPAALLNNNWQWCDLRNATIPDLPPSITKLQAAGAELSGLNKNVLTGISLHDAVLSNAVLDGLGLSGADLTGASFIEASLHGTTLTNAKLVRAHLTGAQLGTLSHLFPLPLSAEAALNSGQAATIALLFKQNGIPLSSNVSLDTLATGRVWQLNDQGNHIVYTIRLETRAGGTQDLMVYAPALAASLVGAYMPDAVLTGANLYEVLASSVQFYGSGAQLDGSAILEEAQLNDSNLSNLNFTQAQLMGTNLSGTHLFNARFNKANLSPSANGLAVNLSSANLQGADFTDAQLYGANLSNAAVAINVPTRAIPTQGGVYLFSLPYRGDTHTLQQYTSELNAPSSKFSLNPKGDAPTLQKYVTALETNNLNVLKIPFLEQHPSIKLSSNAQIQTITGGSVWQIVDGAASYTLWTDIDQNGNTELYAAPSLTNTQAAFHQNNITLRWQATASIDTAGQQWLIDNDSENPQNLSTGYVRFVVILDGNVLDVYGTAVRIERLGDNNRLQIDTETCNMTVLSVTNLNENTVCPNGTKLSVNQAQSGKSWDVKWLRAATPPAPPTCVPTDNSWCPPTSQADKQDSATKFGLDSTQ